jgi:hypothetical protein
VIWVAGQSLIGESQDVDLIGVGALLRIDHIRVNLMVNAQELAFVLSRQGS